MRRRAVRVLVSRRQQPILTYFSRPWRRGVLQQGSSSQAKRLFWRQADTRWSGGRLRNARVGSPQRLHQGNRDRRGRDGIDRTSHRISIFRQRRCRRDRNIQISRAGARGSLHRHGRRCGRFRGHTSRCSPGAGPSSRGLRLRSCLALRGLSHLRVQRFRLQPGGGHFGIGQRQVQGSGISWGGGV